MTQPIIKHPLMKHPKDPDIVEQLHALIKQVGGDPESFDGQLIIQLLQSALQLIPEGHDRLQLKLITRAMKEMRYGYRVFNQYPNVRRVSIFGSARTPEDHPDYIAAHQFSRAMADLDWMCITGAANGIMKAGHEGRSAEGSFGLSIRLPFESIGNSIIEGDPKHVVFRYFFTRKLMFLSHSDALVAFPGGVGTMDELFEALTLMQTGKAHLTPVVLLEGEGGNYWSGWENFFKKQLAEKGWVSPEDSALYYHAPNVQVAIDHILTFYSVYHSSRYVGDQLVFRLNRPLSEEAIEQLNNQFSDLVREGKIYACEALAEEEGKFPELPRLIFVHTKYGFGRLRQLIDAINQY